MDPKLPGSRLGLDRVVRLLPKHDSGDTATCEEVAMALGLSNHSAHARLAEAIAAGLAVKVAYGRYTLAPMEKGMSKEAERLEWTEALARDHDIHVPDEMNATCALRLLAAKVRDETLRSVCKRIKERCGLPDMDDANCVVIANRLVAMLEPK